MLQVDILIIVGHDLKGGRMENKIKKLIEKIGVLKDQLGKLRFDYDLKSSQIEMKIRIAEEKILDLRMKLLKDKEVPKELEYQFGIRWISPNVDLDEDKELGIEFLE